MSILILLRLDALGMGVDEVIAGLHSENVNTPLGRLNRRQSGISPAGRGQTGRSGPVRAHGHRPAGRPARSPWARWPDVQDGMEEQRSLALVNGVPAVALNILKQSGANTVEVVDTVKKDIASLQPELPPGTTIEVVRDGSIMIRDSVHDVKETMIIGGILTILIVFCFFNSWRSTVITGLTLPISVISSFIVMNFLGMTLNVHDPDGPVSGHRSADRRCHCRAGEHRPPSGMRRGSFHAARDGTSEIGLAVLATTFSIVAVFVPVAFMKGIVGRFFFQFGITVAFAVLVSLFVSFTLDPMLSSRWYDPGYRPARANGIVARMLDRFNRLV